MAAEAARAHQPASAAPASPRRRRAQPRAVPRRRLAGGVVWIGVVAVLLTGIVAVNVAVLRLNLRLDNLNQEKARLRTENAQLRNRYAINAVPDTIRSQAQLQGYRPAGHTTYLDLPPRSR